MLTPSELKRVLRAHRLHLTKKLGQNHLVDPRAIERIVEAAACRPDEAVLEIGAGLGALTEPLSERAARVTAVEIDRKIAARSEEHTSELQSQSNLVCRLLLEKKKQNHKT